MEIEEYETVSGTRARQVTGVPASMRRGDAVAVDGDLTVKVISGTLNFYFSGVQRNGRTASYHLRIEDGDVQAAIAKMLTPAREATRKTSALRVVGESEG